MAVSIGRIIKIVKKYLQELRKNQIPIQQVILFGYHAKGNPGDESDIDVALISAYFTGDRFEDRRRIVPLRRNIDNRIEPLPFRPEDFLEGSTLIDAIEKTGINIPL